MIFEQNSFATKFFCIRATWHIRVRWLQTHDLEPCSDLFCFLICRFQRCLNKWYELDVHLTIWRKTCFEVLSDLNEAQSLPRGSYTKPKRIWNRDTQNGWPFKQDITQIGISLSPCMIFFCPNLSQVKYLQFWLQHFQLLCTLCRSVTCSYFQGRTPALPIFIYLCDDA